MEEVIVLEILEKSGKVRERVRLGSFPVKLGRAYDNDIILDDEAVSPHHLCIERNDQDELQVIDLDSENGIYQWRSRKPVTALPLLTDTQLLVGHTHLRLRRTDFAVAPTVHNSRRQQTLADLLANGPVFALLLLTVAGLSVLEQYLVTFQKIKYQELVMLPLATTAMVLVWSGIWAFVGRILVHRAAYRAHASMVLLCLLALFGLDYVTEYYSFAFSAYTSASLIEYAALALAGGLLLYGHLHFATQLRRKAGAITSSLVVGSLLGITLFAEYLDDTRFDTSLSYPTALKPASSMLVQPISAENFLSDVRSMKAQLDKARLEEN